MEIISTINKGGITIKKNQIWMTILLTSFLLVACGVDQNQEQSKKMNEPSGNMSTEGVEPTLAEKNPSSLEEGILNAKSSIEELKAILMNSSSDTKKINDQGSKVEEQWDKIEDMVEEKYPEEYVIIEESLYPLIAEAKKAEPDIDQLTRFMEDTLKKMTKFQEKLDTD